MRNYFQVANSFYGEVYFRVSKHLGWLPSEVIRQKFTPDIRFLRMKYAKHIMTEVKPAEEIKEKQEELN